MRVGPPSIFRPPAAALYSLFPPWQASSCKIRHPPETSFLTLLPSAARSQCRTEPWLSSARSLAPWTDAIWCFGAHSLAGWRTFRVRSARNEEVRDSASGLSPAATPYSQRAASRSVPIMPCSRFLSVSYCTLGHGDARRTPPAAAC